MIVLSVYTYKSQCLKHYQGFSWLTRGFFGGDYAPQEAGLVSQDPAIDQLSS